MKTLQKPLRLLIAATLGAASLGAAAADWSDTWVQYRHGDQFHEPNNKLDVSKDIVQFGNVSGYKYGTNFFTVDWLQSDINDPAKGGTAGVSGPGATEIYMVYRHQLQLSKVTGQDLSFGPVKDIGLTAGFDLNTKDTALASRKRLLVAGPTLKFKVPGTLDVSLLAAKEQNHNDLGSVSKNISFDSQLLINVTWGIPFQVGPVPMTFKGYFNWLNAKGKDYNGKETSPETTSRSYLMADVGQVAFDKKNVFWLGIGYEFWNNKFGNNWTSASRGNLETHAPMLAAELHF